MEYQLEDKLTLLPIRKLPKFEQRVQKAQFITNCCEISFLNKEASLIQYAIFCQPEIPMDSQILNKSIVAIKAELDKAIGLIEYKGKIMWGYKRVKSGVQIIASKFAYKQKVYEYKIMIKQVSVHEFKEIFNYPSILQKFLQMFNIYVKKSIYKQNYIEAGKGRYFSKSSFGQNTISDLGIIIAKGFKFTLQPINQKIYLRVDSCTRVLQTQSFLEVINNQKKDYIKSNYIGNIVIKNYGNHKTSVIVNIDFQKNPLTKFQFKGSLISFKQYFQKQYGVKINNMKQPLIQIQQDKNQKNKDNSKIYLIPQLVSLTGIPNQNQNKNFHQYMKEIGKYTKLNANQKLNKIQDFIQIVGFQSNMGSLPFEIGGKMISQGYILKQPTIELYGQKKRQFKSGTLFIKDKIKDPAVFEDWHFIYSIGPNQQKDQNQADEAFDILMEASKMFGIKFKQPCFLEVQGGKNIEDWKNKLKTDFKKFGKSQIVVLFLNNNQTNLYQHLKKYILSEFQVQSQAVKRRTLIGDKRKAMSAASKLILQMNAKIGLSLWQIKKSHPYFKQKKIIYGGLSITKIGRYYTVGFVGTLQSSSSKFYSTYLTKLSKLQQVKLQVLQKFYEEWITQSIKLTNSLPDNIIIYREGLLNSYIKKLIYPEVKIIKNVITNALNKFNLKIQPSITYIIANKKNNLKYFTINKDKLAENPQSGSVVISSFSQGEFSFCLVPQSVNQGTATPTQFTIVYDDSNIPTEVLIEHTFEQCFNYSNWQGAVRVPACLQYATKLVSFMGESIKQNIKIEDIKKTPYYL